MEYLQYILFLPSYSLSKYFIIAYFSIRYLSRYLKTQLPLVVSCLRLSIKIIENCIFYDATFCIPGVPFCNFNDKFETLLTI
jgi:hypothetical protein